MVVGDEPMAAGFFILQQDMIFKQNDVIDEDAWRCYDHLYEFSKGGADNDA